MQGRLVRVVMCLGLVCGSVGCAPKRLGPTAGGYVFSVQVSNPIVWLGPAPAQFPKVAEVLVEVHDAQGRPAEGVPVTFALDPGWVQKASLSPSETRTLRGRARALFSEPQTIGVARILVRVDGTPAQVTVTVQSYEEPILPY
jgi:hypothetical protein